MSVERPEKDPLPPRAPVSNTPLPPSELPPDLDEFLRDQQFACLTHPTDQGTALVIKAPNADIRSVQGAVPIAFVHELYECPTAPVIRMLTTIYDQPDRPLALETFINVEDPQQRADYETLAQQEQVLLLFYDEGHRHQLTKQAGGLDRRRMEEILHRADEFFRSIPKEQFSFEVAKAWVMGRTSL